MIKMVNDLEGPARVAGRMLISGGMDQALASPRSPVSSTVLADLTWLNIGDICAAFGLPAHAPLRGLAELAACLPARRFARDMRSYDERVGSDGLSAGGLWICRSYSGSLDLRGPTPPRDGPLLIVANHPGILDVAAITAGIPRDDVRVLAITRPMLRALPHIAARLIPVGETAASRMAALRTAARHLRAGGALLTFPAGRIEPDPLNQDGALASLDHWSLSLELLVRLVGTVTVQPVIVGGVLSPAALRHPLTRLRRLQHDRQYLAAILQLLQPSRHRVAVRVRFGQPFSSVGGAVSGALLAEASRLIAAFSTC